PREPESPPASPPRPAPCPPRAPPRPARAPRRPQPIASLSSLVSSRSPPFLLCLDEPVQRSVQRHRHAEPLGLADERARDQVDLGGTPGIDVLEHRRVVRAPPPRRKHVHLPRVLPQLDAGRG